jgi:hypothetical protein
MATPHSRDEQMPDVRAIASELDTSLLLSLLMLLRTYLPLYVLQVLLLLNWGQVRHVEQFADAFASQLRSIALLHHDPDRPKATFTKCSA